MKYFILFFLCLSSFSYADEEVLYVGLAAHDLKPKIGIPLAGYGANERRMPGYVDWRRRNPDSTLFKPSVGVHTPIRAKTMAFKKGKRFLVFISLDLIGIELAFVKDLANNLKKYGIKEKDLIVAGTHTHSGPGTLSRRIPLQIVAVDLFKQENYSDILNKVTKNVEAALKSMVPATLYKSSTLINNVQINKWRKNKEHYDKKATFLIARSKLDQQWLGGMVHFSVHGGTMPVDLMLYSSDVNGAIEKKLEEALAKKNVGTTRPVFVFMNGAEGDVGGRGGRSVEVVDTLAQRFIDQSRGALDESRLRVVKPDFYSTRWKVFVGFPVNDLKVCTNGFLKLLPTWMKLSLYPMMPASSYFTIAQLGDITFFTWPGEPSTQLGYDLQAVARANGAVNPLVIGLANDYLSYFTTKSEYDEGTYDSCSSLYNWEGGRRIIEAYGRILKKKSYELSLVRDL